MNSDFWRLVLLRLFASIGSIVLLFAFHFAMQVALFSPLGLALIPMSFVVCSPAEANADPLYCLGVVLNILDLLFLIIATIFLLRRVDKASGRTSNYVAVLLQTVLTVLAAALIIAYQDYRAKEDFYRASQREVTAFSQENPSTPTRAGDIEQLRIGEENLKQLNALDAGSISAKEYFDFMTKNSIKYPWASSFKGGVEQFPEERDRYITNVAAQNAELQTRIEKNQYEIVKKQEQARAAFLTSTHAEAPNFWDSFARVFNVYRR